MVNKLFLQILSIENFNYTYPTKYIAILILF